MIKGIYGNECHLFSSGQWVNVYVDQCNRAIYYCTCQVKDLESCDDDYDDFLLEPVTEKGDLMNVKEAIKCCQ